MDSLHQKKQCLEEYLRELGGVIIAFSSGVDSTFLLKVAHDVLGEKAIAVTARSCFFPARELEEATAFCRAEGIKQIVVDYEPLSVENVRENPKNRCYLCKRALFSQLRRIAAERGFSVAEGSNMDDNNDYRPGMRAVKDLGADMTIAFNKNAPGCAADFARKTNAKHLVTGMPDNRPNGFVLTVHELLPRLRITTVTEEGESLLYTLDVGDRALA